MTTILDARTPRGADASRRTLRLGGLLRILPAVPALAFLLVFFIVPVGNILRGGLYDANGAFGFAQYARIAHTPVYAKVLWITFEISLVTAALSVWLGYPVAYLLSRLPARSRERWYLWIMLPFWTSFLVKTYAWILLLTRSGVLPRLAMAMGLVHATNGLVPALSGVLIGMVHAMLPLAIMTMLPVMCGIDERLGQAAQTLGADRAMNFFTIFLPLSMPGVAAAGLLVFVSSLGFFIVPTLLGTPQQTMIAQLVISSVLDVFDMRFAAALSTLLLACSIVIFLVYDRAVGLSSLTGEFQARRPGGGSRGFATGLLLALGRVTAPVARLGRGRGRAVPGASTFGPLRLYVLALLALLVLPILSIVPYAFTRAHYIEFPPRLFSLQWFGRFLESPIWQSATIRSFEVGLATATLALVLGFGATLALAKMGRRAGKSMFALVVAPLIVPRVVVAVGLLELLGNLGLAGTNLGLVIGHTVLAIPFVVVTLAAGFKQFDWRLDDAARIMGASPLRRIATIMIPLLTPSLIAAFLFAFMVSFDDLTIAIFVSGGIKTTLPKQMWDDIQLAITPTLAAVSTTLIVVITLAVLLSARLRRRAAD